MWGNPYIKVLRSQLEQFIAEEFGVEQLTKWKNQTELQKVKTEIKKLKKQLDELQFRLDFHFLAHAEREISVISIC
jgi:ubiquinone biosynthesis protein UbiJ